MERLKKAEAVLTRLESGLLVALLSLMIGMSFTQVLLRQFFGIGILWGDTLLRHLVLWVGFLGAALAAVEEKNFAFEALTASLAEKPRSALALLAHLAAVSVSLLLTKASWIFLLDEYAADRPLFEAAGVSVKAWLFAVILPLGFFLVALHTLARAAHCGTKLRAPAL